MKSKALKISTMDRLSICRHAFVFLLMLFGASIVYAQSDLSKVGAYINKAATYSADIEYVYYTTYSSQVPAEKMQGKFARKKNNLYMKMGAVENIMTDYFNFSIDHEEREISILARLKTGDMSKPIGVINFDTLINIKNEIKYSSKNSEVGICEIVSDYMEYEKVEIYYNKNTFNLYKIILFYPIQFSEEIISNGDLFDVQQKAETAPRLEILYKNTKRDEELPDELFSYDKYIIQKGAENYYCKPEYKNYIIN